MSKSVLVRNLSSADAEWLVESLPPGMTQEAYVNRIITEARQSYVASISATETLRAGNAEFKFIDLFAGIGGFYMGMTANGGQCVFTNEWNKFAVSTYRAWTGATHVNSEDIRLIDYAAVIPNHDVLLGGFPCQPFSIAGVSKKNALGRLHGFRDVEQGNLFFAICDIAKIKRPPVMILENVKNLRSHDKGKTWKVINESLDALGYEVRSQVLDARGWVPQHRERIFLVCFDRESFANEEIDAFRFPTAPTQELRLRDILEKKAPPKKYMLTDGLWTYLQGYAAKHQAKGNGFGFGLVTGKDVARTLSARYYKDGSEILVKQRGWPNPRRLTPAEAARLMGFNARFSAMLGLGDSFPQVVSDVQAYKQFGNSVSPLVVEALGFELVKVLRMRRRRLDADVAA